MQKFSPPIVKSIVLIGGGHSHSLFLRMWGMNPIEGVEVLLISNASYAPYSGMLPGYISGKYQFSECNIDLRRLCDLVGAKFIAAEAEGLDLNAKHVFLKNHSRIRYDVLSIDCGSTPATEHIHGAKEHAIAVKPISEFIKQFEKITAEVESSEREELKFIVVGGGAGGVELAFALKEKFSKTKNKLNKNISCKVAIYHKDDEILTNSNALTKKYVLRAAKKKNIEINVANKVEKIENNLVFTRGGSTKFDYLFLVTHASAPTWPKDSGLACDDEGFISVNASLESISHRGVFASGDIASVMNYPRPKSGVIAVRQAIPLFQNIRRYLVNQKLIKFRPQLKFLSLISTSDGKAIASRSFWSFQGRLVWLLKDYIDRKFIAKFSLEELSSMERTEEPLILNRKDQHRLEMLIEEEKIRCMGCGAKASHKVVSYSVAHGAVNNFQRNDIQIGLTDPDDAAVLNFPANINLVQTVDYLPAVANFDPYLFGQIAVNHCFSDIFAMGGTAHSLLASVVIPKAKENIMAENAYQLIKGIVDGAKKLSASLIGGHTAEGPEMALNLTCNGISSERILSLKGAKIGDKLVLTKPIGVGIIYAAQMRSLANGMQIDEAIESMLLSNMRASEILSQNQVSSCTDVTGFGLVGHLVEILKSSNVSVEIELASIPFLKGAIELNEANVHSSLYSKNLAYAKYISNFLTSMKYKNLRLLFDPQTSGGLLFTIASENLDNCLISLKQSGYHQTSVIGQIVESNINNGIRII